MSSLLLKLADRLTRKKWSAGDINRLAGPVRASFLAYAAEEKIRINAASGGCVTAVLSSLMKAGHIDGAVVCRRFITDRRVRTKFELVTDPEQLYRFQGSNYISTSFVREVPDLLLKARGKIAVVGLPCDIAFLTEFLKRTNLPAAEVVLKLGLFCGRTPTKELVDRFTDKLCRQGGSALNSFNFRRGAWRGSVIAELSNGIKVKKPSIYFQIYPNLYFFTEKKCLFCSDHFCRNCDISFGDIWLGEMKKSPLKYSSVLVKTPAGEKFFRLVSPDLNIKEVPVEKIMEGQKRAALTHYNVSARSRAAKLFGIRIPDRTRCRISVYDSIIAFIILFNYRISCSEKLSGIILSLPAPLLKLYLYFFKGLESLR